MKPPQRIHVGWALTAWLIVTAAIALNRGIDLLWGTVALLIAAIASGLVLPRLQLRNISVKRDLPSEAVVGDPLPFSYDIRVVGILPSFGLEISDQLGASNTVVPAAYFAKLTGQHQYRFSWTPTTRGRRTFDHVVVESRFPFGIRSARRHLATAPATLTVYPGFVQLHALPVPAGSDPHAEHLVTSRRGGRDEVFGLKPYRPGDELRSVNWRASARTGEMLVREYEHQQDRELWIVLDLSINDHAGQGDTGTLEYMFRIAHSVVIKAIRQGVPVGLLCRQHGRLKILEPTLDRPSYLRLREALALAESEDCPPLDGWLLQERERLPRGGAWLLFNLGDPERRGRLAQCVRQRGAEPLFVEFDQDSFRRPGTGGRLVVCSSDAGILVSTVTLGSDLQQLFGDR